MAAPIDTIKVNDYVQIDGKEKGRVTSIIKPLGPILSGHRHGSAETRAVENMSSLPSTVSVTQFPTVNLEKSCTTSNHTETRVSSASLNLSSVFSAPIFGGTININFNHTSPGSPSAKKCKLSN